MTNRDAVQKRNAARLSVHKLLPQIRSVLDLPFRMEDGSAPVVVALGEDTIEMVVKQSAHYQGANVFVVEDAGISMLTLEFESSSAETPKTLLDGTEQVAKPIQMSMLLTRARQCSGALHFELVEGINVARVHEPVQLSKRLISA